MNYGSGELRRAERLADIATAQISTVLFGALSRDLCRYDLEEPIAPGEIAMRGCVSTFLVRNLLLERGFRPNGWSGDGPDRQPVYSRTI